MLYDQECTLQIRYQETRLKYIVIRLFKGMQASPPKKSFFWVQGLVVLLFLVLLSYSHSDLFPPRVPPIPESQMCSRLPDSHLSKYFDSLSLYSRRPQFDERELLKQKSVLVEALLQSEKQKDKSSEKVSQCTQSQGGKK